MPKDINVLIIEDDPYARDLMNLLLTRDWRTRVIGEIGTDEDIKTELVSKNIKIDIVLMDTEIPGKGESPIKSALNITKEYPGVKLLLTGTKAHPDTLRASTEETFCGYILKSEIRYSLAAAIGLAIKENKWVLTSSVYKLALQMHLNLPENALMINGKNATEKLTQRESEIARLAILFNMAHRDLADELFIRADQVSKYVSNTYAKLGMDEILNAELNPETFFQDKAVLRRFTEILKGHKSSNKKKSSDMATLAFHLLTMPEIHDF